MYSPKIREDLIPKLYQLAQKRRIPMTNLVSEILEDSLRSMETPTLIDQIMEKYEVPQL